MTGENFLKKTKWLTRVHGQAPKVEEVKENKEILDIDKKLSEKFIRDYVACTPCEMGKPNSILEKLREDLEERIKEYKGKLSTKKITKQTTQDKILLIRINELEVVLIVLTSLSSEEQPEDPKGKIYREWVEKEKKHFFEQYKDLLPEEQPQFTPWQEIEVSNDGEKWEKRTFQNMIKEKFQCWQTEEEHNKTTMFLKLWQFARPLEQVTIPEFDYDKIHMEAMKDHVGSFATHVAHPLCKQMSEITHFLHSQFPNSKK